MTPEEKRLAAKKAILKAKIAAAAPKPSGDVPEGMFFNPQTGQYTSRDMLARNMEPGGAEAAAAGAYQGISFGFGDEASGLLNAAIPGEGTAAERKTFATEYERARYEASRRDRPKTTLAGEVGGAVAGIAAPGAGIMRGAAGTAGQVARGAAAGAVGGGVMGFGQGEGGIAPRARSAATGAVAGAAAGALVPAVSAVIRKPIEGVMKSAAMRKIMAGAPSADDLRAAAKALYDQADNMTMPRAGMTGPVQSAVNDAGRMGMDPMVTPTAARVADNLTDAATSPNPTVSFRELDTLRNQAGIAAGDMNKRQAAVGIRFQDAVDEVIEGADPAVFADVKRARELWGKLRRSEMIEGVMENSDSYLAGETSGIRNQLARIVRNPRLAKGFSSGEIALMKDIVSGGLLQRTIGAAGSGLGRLASVALGASTGGTAGAVAGAAVNMGARKASDAMLMKQAAALRGLVAAGGATIPKLSGSTRNTLDAIILGVGIPASKELQPQSATPRPRPQ